MFVIRSNQNPKPHANAGRDLTTGGTQDLGKRAFGGRLDHCAAAGAESAIICKFL